MNFLLFAEARLRYWVKYHARMGQFRPIRHMFFDSQITGKQESLKQVVSETSEWEITIYQGEKEIFWDLTEHKILELDVADGEAFCVRFKPQIDSLHSLAQHVASLYNIGRHCLCCGNFCGDKYCSDKCKNAIPCDKCARNRLASYYDLDPDKHDDRDTLYCKFCQASTEPPKFSLDILVSLVFETMPAIESKMCGTIQSCYQCDRLFMHDDDEQKKCFLCCARCER